MRRRFLKLAATAGGALLAAPVMQACTGTRPAIAIPSPLPPTPAPDILAALRGLGIEDFFQQAYRSWMSRDPETLSALGLADLYGVGDGNLTDISDSFILETQSLESGTLDVLRHYDRSRFSAAVSITADVFDWFLDDLVRGHPFMSDDYPVSPVVTSVPYNLFMLLTVYHPLNHAQDARDYISRLSQVGTKFTQLIDALHRREHRGVILPGFLLEYVLPDITSLAHSTPASHAYFISFASRVSGVSEEQRASLAAQVQDEVKLTVMPAYANLAACLDGERATASNTVGVWQFSNGEAYYAQCLRHHTTTDMTAAEIHALGRENVDRVQDEMRTRFSSLGYPTDESMPHLFERLTADIGEYSGKDAVNAYEEAIALAGRVAPQAFDAWPRAKVQVIGGRDGDYYTPAAFDRSRPGMFFARTDISSPRFGFKTTAFHETIPGHHFQIALAEGVPGLPDLRRGLQFNAYTEGWALYAERLMAELGAYADDPASDLGRLRMEAFRAARLVVDSGIHSLRWSFNQAVDYMVQATGHSVGFVQGEITRYSVWPGQAASYYIGYLKLMELRRKAQDALGRKFALKAFHHIVLANGSVPLAILVQLIDGYIAANH